MGPYEISFGLASVRMEFRSGLHPCVWKFVRGSVRGHVISFGGSTRDKGGFNACWLDNNRTGTI